MQCSLYLIFYPLSHAHKATVMELKWNKNGNWLLTASRDHLLKVFDIRNMKEEIQTFKGHKKEATGRLNYRYILIKLTWMRSIRLKLNIFFYQKQIIMFAILIKFYFILIFIVYAEDRSHPIYIQYCPNKDNKIIFQFIFYVLWFCTILMKVFDLYRNTCICMSSVPNKRTVLWLFPQQLFVCIHFYRNVQVYKFERYYDKLQKKTKFISCMDMFI